MSQDQEPFKTTLTYLNPSLKIPSSIFSKVGRLSYEIGVNVDDTLQSLKNNNLNFRNQITNHENNWHKKILHNIQGEWFTYNLNEEEFGRISEIATRQINLYTVAEILDKPEFAARFGELLKKLILDQCLDMKLARAISISYYAKKIINTQLKKEIDSRVISQAVTMLADGISTVEAKSNTKIHIESDDYSLIYSPSYSIPWNILIDFDVSAAIEHSKLCKVHRESSATLKRYQQLYAGNFNLDQYLSAKENRDKAIEIQWSYRYIFEILEHFSTGIFCEYGHGRIFNGKVLKKRPAFGRIAQTALNPTRTSVSGLRAFFSQFAKFQKQMQDYGIPFDNLEVRNFLGSLMSDNYCATTGFYKKSGSFTEEGLKIHEWLTSPALDSNGNPISYSISEVDRTLSSKSFSRAIYTKNMTNLTVITQILNEGDRSLLCDYIFTYFNDVKHTKQTGAKRDGVETILRLMFNSNDLGKSQFAKKWEYFYGILNKTMEHGSVLSQPNRYEIKNGHITGISPFSENNIDFVNRLYRNIFDSDAVLLDSDANYFPSDSEHDRFVSFSSDQLRSLDEIIYFFAQLFTFINPTDDMSINYNCVGGGQKVNLPKYAEFNDLLQKIYAKYEFYHETLNGRPEFGKIWIPFVYRISELKLHPDILLGSKKDFKYTMVWPTPTDPARCITFGCMSDFEVESFRIIELLRKVGALTHLISSKQTKSVMHHSKIEDSGEVDIVAGLFNKFIFMTEHMGAGKEMFIPASGHLVANYGEETDDGVKICRERYRFPIICVAIREKVLQWYDDNAESVGKIAPSITEVEFYTLLIAMAYVSHSDIKTLIIAMGPYSSLYSEMNNDPLKIALYLLACNVQLPAMDHNTGNLWNFTSSFHELCGLENIQLAKDIQHRFGIYTLQEFQTSHFSTSGFSEWWKDRDDLIRMIELGSIPSGVFEQGYRIFAAAQRSRINLF